RTESLPCLATEEFTKDKEVKSGTSESTTSATVPQEENTAVSTSDKISPERAKGEVVAGQIDTAGESSQATERDVARSEFSLEQQSSQELDEESLSMGAYCVTIPPHEHSLLADSEDTSSTTTPSNQQWRWKQPDRGRGALKDGSQLKMLELVSEHSTDTDVEEKHIEKETPKIASDSQSDSSPKAADVCHLHGSLGSAEESAAKGVPCTHKFTCTQCGQAVHETTTGAIRKVKDIESTSKPCLPHVHRKSATIEDIITEKQDDEQDIGVHAEAYRSAQWFYIGSKDELIVWGHRLSPERAQEAKDSRADDVTDLEKSFRKQYDAVTHRMIHRKASIEMYRKILENSFSVEKMVNVNRSKGEFGFRIHGSRPVVVSAIEKGTPAETCGLEIGDIVVSVNGIDVLEASHSDVVRLAHSGSECLRLELVPTCHILEKSKSMDDTGTIICGYLEKKCCNILSDTQEVMWKRRWFVLKTDLYLYSYKNADETELLGAFSLQSCCASIVPGKGSEGSSTIFKISKYLESPQFFADSDEKSAVKWVNALNEASNKLSQVDPFMETTLRRIHVSPDSISNEDASGFLEKFNQRRKMWKQRYFVLKDACLYFYADRSSTTAL
ncbi:PDZ and PH domain containing protein-like protein, partial [Leptotrombidium deliense]